MSMLALFSAASSYVIISKLEGSEMFAYDLLLTSSRNHLVLCLEVSWLHFASPFVKRPHRIPVNHIKQALIASYYVNPSMAAFP